VTPTCPSGSAVTVIQTLQLGNIQGTESLAPYGGNRAVGWVHHILRWVDGKRCEAVVHDGVVVISHATGINHKARVAVGVVSSIGLPSVGTCCRESGLVRPVPGVLEELTGSVRLDVAPDHAHIAIPVRSVHLVHESKGMEQFVDDDLQVDTPVLLEADLHPPPASPVGDLGIAAPASRNDVNIVVLVSSSNKPDTTIILHVGEP